MEQLDIRCIYDTLQVSAGPRMKDKEDRRETPYQMGTGGENLLCLGRSDWHLERLSGEEDLGYLKTEAGERRLWNFG